MVQKRQHVKLREVMRAPRRRASVWRRQDASGAFARPACVRKSPLRVALIPRQGALDSPGGGEVQLLRLAGALAHWNVKAEVRTVDERDLATFDCVHLFGSSAAHLSVVEIARRNRKPVVLSPIAWFDLAARLFAADSAMQAVRGCAGLLFRRALPRLGGWRRQLYQSANLLMPNSQAEAEQLHALFGVPEAKMRVVCNAASARFAEGCANNFAAQVGGRGFVLCVGRIEPRKNQLRLLRALWGTGTRVVFIGDVVPGHERYAEQCRRAADANVTFLNAVAHHDPLLADAYAACGCLALVSWFETPGLAALEAAMSGTPLVLTDRGATQEYFGPYAQYVSPRDERSIRRNVLWALEQPRSKTLARHVASRFTWESAAETTMEAYEHVR